MPKLLMTRRSQRSRLRIHHRLGLLAWPLLQQQKQAPLRRPKEKPRAKQERRQKCSPLQPQPSRSHALKLLKARTSLILLWSHPHPVAERRLRRKHSMLPFCMHLLLGLFVIAVLCSQTHGRFKLLSLLYSQAPKRKPERVQRKRSARRKQRRRLRQPLPRQRLTLLGIPKRLPQGLPLLRVPSPLPQRLPLLRVPSPLPQRLPLLRVPKRLLLMVQALAPVRVQGQAAM